MLSFRLVASGVSNWKAFTYTWRGLWCAAQSTSFRFFLTICEPRMVQLIINAHITCAPSRILATWPSPSWSTRHPHHRLHLHVWPRQGAGSDLRGRSWRDLRGFAFPRGNYEIYSHEEWMLPAWVEETLTLTTRHTSNQLVKSPHAASRISSLPDKRHPRKEDNALGIFHSQSLPSWSLPQERCWNLLEWMCVCAQRTYQHPYWPCLSLCILIQFLYYTYRRCVCILYINIYTCMYFLFMYLYWYLYVCYSYLYIYVCIYDFIIVLFTLHQDLFIYLFVYYVYLLVYLLIYCLSIYYYLFVFIYLFNVCVSNIPPKICI